MTPAAIQERAAESGIRCVGLSDHLWTDRKGRWRPSPSRLLGMRPGISRLPRIPRLLIGAEIDCHCRPAPGRLEETVGFDFLIVADHLADLKSGAFHLPTEPETMASRLMDGFRLAASHPRCRIVGHPFYLPAALLSRMSAARPGYAQNLYSSVAERAVELTAIAFARGIAVELNARALDLRLRSLLLPVFRAALSTGCRFTLGSDAHSLAEIGSTIRLKDYAEEIGVKSGELLTVDELLR